MPEEQNVETADTEVKDQEIASVDAEKITPAEEESQVSNKPLDEMNDAERADYWKRYARKHEKNEKAAVAELEKLREEKQSEKNSDKMVNDSQPPQADDIKNAREEGRLAGLKESSEKAVQAVVQLRLSDPDQADEILAGMNVSAFVDNDGIIDFDKLDRYVTRFSDGLKVTPNPHQGNRGVNVSVSSAELGRSEAAKRFGKK